MSLKKVLSFTSKNPKLCCSLKLKNNARRAFCSIIWVYWISRVWNSRKWSKTPLPLGMDTEGLLFLLICTMRSSPHFVSSRGGKKAPQISVRRWLNTGRYHLRVPIPSNTAVFGWIYSLEDTWIEEVINDFWRPFGSLQTSKSRPLNQRFKSGSWLSLTKICYSKTLTCHFLIWT